MTTTQVEFECVMKVFTACILHCASMRPFVLRDCASGWRSAFFIPPATLRPYLGPAWPCWALQGPGVHAISPKTSVSGWMWVFNHTHRRACLPLVLTLISSPNHKTSCSGTGNCAGILALLQETQIKGRA